MSRITMNSLAIPVKKVPEAKLNDCLSNLVKEDLAVMGVSYGIKIAMSKLKGAMVSLVAEQVLAQFKERVMYSGVRTLSGFTRLINGNVSYEELFDHVSLLGHLQMQGWVFFFECEEELHIVVPEEIREAYKAILSEAKNVEKIREMSEYRDYALALVSLYGTCPVSQLNAVWNSHHRPEVAPDELAAVLNEVSKAENLFYLNDECLISAELSEKTDVEELLASQTETGYYMPSEEEICIYADESIGIYDEDEVCLKFKNLLSEKLPPETIEELFSVMRMEAKLSGESRDVMECFNEYKVSFSTKEEAKQIKDAFQEWYGAIRKWNLGGYNLKERYEFLENRVKIPVRRDVKIGRNELCPCNSGKKYKHCCGK